MPRKMLVNAAEAEETRVAILNDGVLDELNIEFHAQRKIKGNIYTASVVRVEPSIQAAFLDYGAERHGFLSISEVNFNLFKPKGGKRRIEDLIKRGDRVLVQAIREERGQKGAALSTFVSLPGRYLVLMPDCSGGGISRKIEDAAERKQLKAFFQSLEAEEGGEPPGLIIRTAGLGRSIDALRRDYGYLKELWARIQEVSEKRGDAPGLVYQEHDIITRTIRDYFSSDIDEILVDNEEVAERIREFLRRTMAEYVGRVTLHREKRPIFSRYQTEEQIATIYKRQVPLPSGGSIVVDPTEALVAIDVNSGRSSQSRSPEETSFRTNMEAASEIARQLRLRDLGGLIVCDFIDMVEAKHRHQVEEALKQAMKGDKARFDVGKISKFGLLELSRQRVKASLLEGSHDTCTACEGTGRVASVESVATGLIRALQTTAANPDVQRIEITAAPQVATYLLNDVRDSLVELERRRDVEIYVANDPTLLTHQSRSEVIKRRQDEVREVEEVATPLDVMAPEVASDAGSQATSELTAEAGAGNRRRRRRRRGRGRTAGEPVNGEAAPHDAGSAVPEGGAVADAGAAVDGAAATAVPVAALQPEVKVAAAEEVVVAKKKRSRRRRRKKAAAEAVTSETLATPSGEASPGAGGPSAPPATAPGSEGPPAATVPVPVPEAGPAATSKPTAAPTMAADEAVEEGGAAAVPAEAEAGEGTALPTEAESVAPAAPAKKKRAPAQKRAAKKKVAAAAPAEAEAGTALPTEAESVAPAAPAKKKRPAAKKRAVKKAASQTEADGAAPEATKPATPAKKKRAAPKKRTVKKRVPASPTPEPARAGDAD
jgi:ribonuclease E